MAILPELRHTHLANQRENEPEEQGVGTKPITGDIHQGAGQNILFVEDEEALLKLGQRMFEKIGYRVTPASNPVTALAELKSDPAKFALLITDLTMPGLSGLDLATQARRINPSLPIIIITGDPTALDPEDLKPIGIRQIIAKPFAIAEVAQAIQKALA